MAKILVKLKENSFLDLYKNQYIMADRPYVVEQSSAIESVCAQGKMEVLCNTLKPEASDEKLQEFLKKDKDGLKAFLAEYDAKAVKAPAQNNQNQNQNPGNGKDGGNAKSKK